MLLQSSISQLAYENCSCIWEQLDYDIPQNFKNKVIVVMVRILISDIGFCNNEKILIPLQEYLSSHKKLQDKVIKVLFTIASKKLELSPKYYMNVEEYLHHSNMNMLELIEDATSTEITEIDFDVLNNPLANTDIAFSVFKLALDIKNDEHYKIFNTTISFLINKYESLQDIHIGYDKYSISDNLKRNLLVDLKSAEITIAMLFNNRNFKNFSDKIAEIYNDAFGNMVLTYFDAYDNRTIRTHIEHVLDMLANTLNRFPNKDDLLKIFYPSLIFSTPHMFTDYWNTCNTHYSVQEKEYIIKKFVDYGKYDINETIRNFIKLKSEALLPEGLEALAETMTFSSHHLDLDSRNNLLYICSIAFYKFRDEIKKDEMITEYFENILTYLVVKEIPEAAVILEEFRIH
jgi:hypothetical protein